MKIHEYQAKSLFRHYGISVPEGAFCTDIAGAKKIAEGLQLPIAVKAQIHAGGRGKGGGVKLARSLAEVEQYARSILGMHLITAQTGPAGRLVKTLLLEEGVSIDKELYISFLPDRESASIAIVASCEGGMDIEKVAAERPEKIIKVAVNPMIGIRGYHVNQVLSGLGLDRDVSKEFGALLCKLYALLIDYDCSLVEINPLVITTDKRVVALDAKMDIDSNSLYRHDDIRAMHDPNEDDPIEAEAQKYKLNYINLDGNVGNMVNGAGLAMATMDIIKQAGAEPANFLDVGGGADADMVANGFRIILSDTKVQAILINIFGGILRCDILAQGVVEAAKRVGLSVPVVVRMEGTNVNEGRKILADSGLDLISALDLSDAAQKIAKLVAA